MVRLSFLVLSVATAFASVASAAPYFHQQHFTKSDLFNLKCISDLDVREYESFKLKNIFLGTFVSKIDYDNMLVADNPDDSAFHELEFCIVSSDGKCNPDFPTNCIYENVEYRIKVNGPVKGYLQADDDVVTIQPRFEDASALSLSRGKDGGLRIFQRSSEDEILALAGLEPIVAYVWEYPEMNEKRQWFELTRRDNGKCLQW
ncbi:hypothetical protein BGZ52_012293 [Haplosporangium bisporale]|nr:hypothetical protein BGZ52_012293 [Haplosporangium bisporale]KAF9210287.1 hypothetical protein BGZ59_009633 [Podila verticillata]